VDLAAGWCCDPAEGGGESAVAGVEVSELVCEHGLEVTAVEQSAGDHQGVGKRGGVLDLFIEDEPDGR
jgi:hypothetical protein